MHLIMLAINIYLPICHLLAFLLSIYTTAADQLTHKTV